MIKGLRNVAILAGVALIGYHMGVKFGLKEAGAMMDDVIESMEKNSVGSVTADFWANMNPGKAGI